MVGQDDDYEGHLGGINEGLKWDSGGGETPPPELRVQYDVARTLALSIPVHSSFLTVR